VPARPSRTSALIIAIGIVIAAALLSPVGAVAAGQLVEISSTSGRKADVTRAEQLQVAEASPHQLMRGRGLALNGCANVLTAPSSKAIVVKTVILDFYYMSGTGGHFGVLRIGDTCSSSVVAIIDVTGITTEHVDFGPGVVVPAGQSLWVYAEGGGIDVFPFGYKVPPTAVPATTATTDDIGLVRPEG
jgi:hypothetical protein